ncbi:MAG: DNA ligase D [Brevefilum sp.]
MSLKDYRSKRDFSKTSEPSEKAVPEGDEHIFVIHKHGATRLHYDLRLQVGDVLKSWAVPKGPSLDPEEKRLAILVEDHPLSYSTFEDVIPEGQYGAGEVILWDQGIWHGPESAEEAIKSGKLNFELEGVKLHGGWTLVQMRGEENEDGKNWLLIKQDDAHARRESENAITESMPESVKSGRTLEDLRTGKKDGVLEGQEDDPRLFWKSLAQKLDRSRDAEWPGFIKVQLASLTEKVPGTEDWLHEVKFDGYRLMALLHDGAVRLFTRNENDWSDKYPSVCRTIEALPVQDAIIDGEVVALGPDGISDFQALNHLSERDDVFYYAFDLLYLSGYDLQRVPLVGRKRLLQTLLSAAGQRLLRFSQHTVGKGGAVYENACQLGLEGIISKRTDSIYASGRTRTWRKIKCLHRQDFVIGGYTDPEGSRVGLGALVLGYYDDEGKLVYAGRVGTGFDDQQLKHLSEKLKKLEVQKTRFDVPPQGQQLEKVHWVEPELVAEVRFTNWTHDKLVRHGSFQGLQEDVGPLSVRCETDSDKKASSSIQQARQALAPEESARVVFAGVRLSHPDRVLWPEQGVTKRELASYYEYIGDRMLPHIVDRPLSLLRCPRGHERQCFFQKNYNESIDEPIKTVELEQKDGEKATYMAIDNLAGLIELAQLGTLELHPWGSRTDRLERPDVVIFDLDPGPDVAWEWVLDAARQVRRLLSAYGLTSYVKTSGGKGLHVLAPLVRRVGWDSVKAFAHGMARQMAREAPGRYVSFSSKSKRKGKIFIDYLRNNRGSTNVAVYSTRARAGAPISTPLRWEELADLESSDFYHMGNIRRRVDNLPDDPWDGYFRQRQSITKKMLKALEKNQ